ncbi:MAG TPA: ribosomal protein S18-alanine N-acetyltransferase [Mycobacteriales bacterium]|jgi:ribosomal-protein-alanine N-acetyltransferase|nr:ribosomal protein S18-alanine N-acetyltransferase [Mycobacteriales bacterium]
MKTERMRWWHIEPAIALDADLFGPEQWSVRMLWSELAQAPTRHYLVAVDGAELIGYAGLAALGDEGFIQTIGVRESHQRRGVGAALLEELLAEADGRSVPAVLLEVRVDNLVAQRLYKRNGFEPLRIRKGYYQNSGVDALEMRRG